MTVANVQTVKKEKLPANESAEMQWNKLCVYILDPKVTERKLNSKRRYHDRPCTGMFQNNVI